MSADRGTPFDPFGPLPSGRVAIEASAGTGKTYTLAALATRYLAEQDITPSDLLIVTFTRAATAELRSRIRSQLVESAAALAGDDAVEGDLLRTLASTERHVRRRRLEQAVTDFDAASISTIHGFATQVRRTLGLTAAVDPDATLTPGNDDLVVGACADALAAASARSIQSTDFPSLEVLVEATKKKVGGRDLVLEPDQTVPGIESRFVLAHDLVMDSLRRLDARRLAEGSIGFDEVLVQLAAALTSGDADAVVAALRSRYKVVLIDEFQDTDRVQWEIFSTLFGRPGTGSTLVLVGDPKQAIYRFRGADIAVYLDVLGDPSVDGRYTLGTNWRADGRCLAGLHALLDGATFGDPAISYGAVRAAEDNRERAMTGVGGASLSGLDVRVAPKAELPRRNGSIDTDQVNRLIERDVAGHVRDLLEHASIPSSKDDATPRQLQASDVAVLVTAWNQAYDLQRAFAREGIPAVVAGSGSVLDSEAAQHVRYLLEAMERPGDLRRVRTFAVSWFVGMTVDQVASADDRTLAHHQERLGAWALRLAERPVVEVLAQIWQETGVIARALGGSDGNRSVTDLDHLAEVLHSAAPQGRSGVAGLLATLDAPPDGTGDADTDNDLLARRIESEARTVLITTVWRAKGLEFPVVCLPMMWRVHAKRRALVYTDPDTGHRMLDVTLNGDWSDGRTLADRKALAAKEEAAERLRILYVALTRARHHTAVWWAGNAHTTNALTRLLFARDAEGAIRPAVLDPQGPKRPALNGPADPVAALAPLSIVSGGALSVTIVPVRPDPTSPWSAVQASAPGSSLEVAEFDRRLDRTVSRWSFTAITSHEVEDLLDPSDPSGADAGASDESTDESDGATQSADADGEASPLDAVDPHALLGPLAAGTSFGTFVHGILEEVDFSSTSLRADVLEVATTRAAYAGIDLDALAPPPADGTALLVDGVCAAIGTPLGPLFAGKSLADLPRTDRIDELSFDLRINTKGEHLSPSDIGRLAVRYLEQGHPLYGWAQALAEGSIDVQLGGYLTGSIDLVARVRDAAGAERYVIADYKTNRLTGRGRPQGVDDYGPDRLADAMAEHHYPLQALLYASALHRYLRWKRRASDEATLVTGAAYLFLRGMTGPNVPHGPAGPHGVFTWALPPDLVVGLSDLLDRGAGSQR